MAKRIGIMGGTFDPIHNAHLLLADEACDHYDLEKVLFVVAPNPPHKEPISGVCDRVEMTKLAIKGNNRFELSTIELERGGVSYTVDTIKELHTIYGENCELYLILGSDEASAFMNWHKPFEILSMAKVVCAKRPGHEKEIAPVIETFEMPEVDISSTYIREKVKNNNSARYLMPNSVADYITKKKLYRGDDE